MYLVGDIHGKVLEFQKLISTIPSTEQILQIGDVGFGFREIPEFPANVKLFRGNHDNPELARKHPNYLGDYGWTGKFLYIAGALSVDRNLRTPGVSWWPDEELSQDELNKVYELYVHTEPKFVISHECPSGTGKFILDDIGLLKPSYASIKQGQLKSRTAETLQRMFEAHTPHTWVFGHYHTNWNKKLFNSKNISETEFQCLGELEVKRYSEI